MRFAVVALLMVFVPARARHLLARKVLGWDIHPTAHLGRSLYLVKHLSMGPEATIGSLNMFRGLQELRLEHGATIATRNWVAAHPASARVFPHATSSLILHEWAKVTNAHIIDCTDRVEIGAHAALAGFRTQILTHSLDLVRDKQICRPVTIGEHSAVMSGSMLLCGTSVPPRCIVSAGSVVTTQLSKEDTLYRGNPALPIRKLPRLRFFERTAADERRAV